MKHARITLALCTATLAAACSAPAHRQRPESAATDPSSTATHTTKATNAKTTKTSKVTERLSQEVDLTGRWSTGSTDEPTVAKIVLQPPCRITPGAWILQQSDDTIQAWSIPESYAQGISRGPAGPATEPSRGRISGLNVVISDAQSRYVLRYDTSSGHLRGTKNGAPFWAVHQEIVRVEDCPPVP